MLKLLILTIQANCMSAIMQIHDLNLGFLCNYISCLKKFTGIKYSSYKDYEYILYGLFLLL
jgi:hypothetical protein